MRRSFPRFILAALLIALTAAVVKSPLMGQLGGDQDPLPDEWTIEYPTDGTEFNDVDDVNGEGDAADALSAYTFIVKYDGNGGGQRSDSGMSTFDHNWSSTVSPPPAHGDKWPIGAQSPNGSVELWHNQMMKDSKTINFVDPD